MKHLLSMALVMLFTNAGFGQQKYTLSGYVRDSLSRETLIGASVSIKGESKGVNSNTYGFYSITLAEGEYTVVASFVGYLPIELPVSLHANADLDIALLAKSSLSQETFTPKLVCQAAPLRHRRCVGRGGRLSVFPKQGKLSVSFT